MKRPTKCSFCKKPITKDDSYEISGGIGGKVLYYSCEECAIGLFKGAKQFADEKMKEKN